MASETTIETVETDGGVFIAVEPGGEIPADAVEELAEEIAEEIAEETGDVSDAVAIAAIEADRDVTIAEIHAEVSTAAIEAEAEREETWQEQLADLRANMQTLTTQVMEIAANLSPALADPSSQLPLTEAAEIAEAVAVETAEAEANNSTPLFMSPPTSETQTEVILESEGEKPEAATATVIVRKKRRLI